MVKIGAAVAENGSAPHVAQQAAAFLKEYSAQTIFKGKNVIFQRSPQCLLTVLARISVRLPASGPRCRVRLGDLNSVPCAHARLCGLRRGVNFQPKMPKVLVFHVPRPFRWCVQPNIFVLIGSPCSAQQTLFWDLNLTSPFASLLSCACQGTHFHRFWEHFRFVVCVCVD